MSCVALAGWNAHEGMDREEIVKRLARGDARTLVSAQLKDTSGPMHLMEPFLKYHPYLIHTVICKWLMMEMRFYLSFVRSWIVFGSV